MISIEIGREGGERWRRTNAREGLDLDAHRVGGSSSAEDVILPGQPGRERPRRRREGGFDGRSRGVRIPDSRSPLRKGTNEKEENQLSDFKGFAERKEARTCQGTPM